MPEVRQQISEPFRWRRVELVHPIRAAPRRRVATGMTAMMGGGATHVHRAIECAHVRRRQRSIARRCGSRVALEEDDAVWCEPLKVRVVGWVPPFDDHQIELFDRRSKLMASSVGTRSDRGPSLTARRCPASISLRIYRLLTPK